jgi:DNA-binding LacI/PurR family transcriptional regulator
MMMKMAGRKSPVTMKEVAQKAGVSLKTVSNVVNNFRFVSDQTREKVNKAIKELGYTVNATARNLRSGRHGLITLAVPDIRMPYFAELSTLVIAEAHKSGFHVLIRPTLYSRQSEIEALQKDVDSVSDGMIFSPLELGQKDIDLFHVDYPLVVVGERVTHGPIDYIGTENIESVKRATAYLIHTGCRHIAALGVHEGEENGTAFLRLQGYKEALEEAGLQLDPRYLALSEMWHRDDGYEAMNRLLDQGLPIDGVVAFNDMLASGAIHAIELKGLSIPDDISVIGFDNNDDSQYLTPPLSSVSPNLAAVARLSVATLVARINGQTPLLAGNDGHVNRIVTSSLVLRKSTKISESVSSQTII